MNKLFEWFGGRKTMFALILFAVVTILLLVNKCEFSGWSEFTIWIFGAYAIGNGVEHIANGFKKKE